MGNQQFPSKKRKINYMQSEQIENGINSSMDDSPCDHVESPNKHQALSKGSKRIASVRTLRKELNNISYLESHPEVCQMFKDAGCYNFCKKLQRFH
jgi:hypothetical protein